MVLDVGAIWPRVVVGGVAPMVATALGEETGAHIPLHHLAMMGRPYNQALETHFRQLIRTVTFFLSLFPNCMYFEIRVRWEKYHFDFLFQV